MSIDPLLPRPAQRDVVQNAAIMPNMCGLAHDDARAMIEHDATPQRGIGMDIDLAPLGHLALQMMRQDPAVRPPEMMRGPMRLQGMKALEVEKDVGETGAGRVAIAYGEDVGAEVAAEGDVAVEGLADEGHDLHAEHGGAREAVGEVEGQG